MALSESQLDAWSNPGATTGSALTYTSIKAALDAHTWPVGMEWTAYLQGSYANTTNIRGNSDVDVVVEMTSVFYHDLTEAQKQARGFTSSGRFRYDVEEPLGLDGHAARRGDLRGTTERYARPSTEALDAVRIALA